ncbi:calcium-binding mitochondrial carrier protein SCaMC-2-like [Limulus polyphemus]|uniref:Calcium-binding mitochondrial carrier protein SCaMC-2-like n=1 Tax=Limulus polyphemus TaxID=6850 RepID=A0ABM1BQG0_LIMPO|nr:calcium-binding mitochondrial carrier protein SCaMC-2-like [Limulus polyphemus]
MSSYLQNISFNHPPHYYQELPSEEEERLEKLFKQLDIDEDGRIDFEDLTEALQRMGLPHIPSHVAKFIEKSDLAKSGNVDFAEFVHYVIEHEKQLMVVFKSIDQNKDGRIDALDISNAFKKLGISLNHQEAICLVQRMDKDKTLTINFDEWRSYLLFHPSPDLKDIYHYWRHSTFVDIGEDTLVPDDFTETEMQTGMWWRHLVAGGIAGAVSRTFTAPLDRLKVFLQVKGAEFASVRSCFVHMLHEGGIHSLWRGNGINVLKIAPESALKFMAYEQAKRFIRSTRDSGRDLGILERFIAGSLAGGFSQTVIYPLEVLKTRLALRKTGQYYGIWDAANKLYNNGGIKNFYRGYVPNLLGILPYAGIDLAIYETLKKMYLRQHSKQEDPGVLVLLACGTISSSCGQIASYPLALVRTRLQVQENTSENSMVSVFRGIVQREGFSGLYRGMTPNFMKVAPAVSISYVVYEHVRRMLGVSMT